MFPVSSMSSILRAGAGISALSKLTLGSGAAAAAPAAQNFHTAPSIYAARKGTRARKEKAKVKKEVPIRQFLQRRLKGDPNAIYTKQRPFSKAHYPRPIDDVYFYRKYDYTQWDFGTAVQNHREIHHPTVYNKPGAQLILRIDIDLRYPNRPQKCQDKWKNIIEMHTPFQFIGMAPPSILAFCPNDSEIIAEVLKAGAEVAGGTEIVKSIQTGEILASNFEYIISHPLMMPEITSLRGLMKKNFPSTKAKTISVDLPNVITRLKKGLKVVVVSNDQEPDYGYIETPIGTLDMDLEGLQGNFEAILRETIIKRVPGKHPNDFILQCILKTPESFEEFKINIQELIPKLDKKPRIGKGKEEMQEEEIEEAEEDDEEDSSPKVVVNANAASTAAPAN